MSYEPDNPRPSALEEELRLIPGWSIVLAVLLVAFAQYFSFVLMPRHHNPGHIPPPLYMRVFWSTSWGAVLGVYGLLIGYISKDAKRRHMNAGLWMLAAIFMPGGIGTVVYFLLRQPLVTPCPGCGTSVEAGDNFCSQCRYQAALCCEHCYRTVRPTDVYCTRCGHDLATESSPLRLRETVL